MSQRLGSLRCFAVAYILPGFPIGHGEQGCLRAGYRYVPKHSRYCPGGPTLAMLPGMTHIGIHPTVG